MTIRRLCGVAIFLLMLALPLSAYGPREVPEDLYLLHIPGLGEGTTRDPNMERHLVRLRNGGTEGTLRRVFPDLYFGDFTGWRDFWRQRLPPGLVVTRGGADQDTVTLAGIIVSLPVYYSVTLEGREREPGYWEGEAWVKMFPYGHPMRGHWESKWSLQPAPRSAVYKRTLAALEHLRKLSKGPRVYYDGPPLETGEDYVAYLRKGNWPLPEGSISWKPIEPRFREAIAEALAEGRIVMREKGFAVSKEVMRTFVEEDPLRTIDTEVTAHGVPQPEMKELTDDERRLEQSLRDYRPPRSAFSIRRLASLPEAARNQRLAVAGRRVERFVSDMDYTWEELQFVPGIAFLAEHVASVPEKLRDRVAQRYIRDGSDHFFPNMNWEQLARIPNPVLLMACLPRMEQTAKRQAKELSEILHNEGYTLEDLEKHKVPLRTRRRIRRRHLQFNDLARSRIPLGQAKKLAETARVRKLLETSGLEIEQIDQYEVSELVAKILSRLSAKQAQQLIEDTPKFMRFLGGTDNEQLKELIRGKNLNVQPDQSK